jgi:hypothetical protein
MMELFDVHVLGFEVSEERATRALMRVFGLNEAASRIFVHSVPRIGKRRVPKDTAERYIRALHAVGAIVECRLCTPSTADPGNQVSLPAPTVSSFPGTVMPHIMQDSFGVMAPVAYSPHMPTIPKAPRIPADLHAIRARKGPDSLAPHWRPADSPEARMGFDSSQRAPASFNDNELKSPNPDELVISSAGRLGAQPSPPALSMQETSLDPKPSPLAAKAASGAVFDSDGQLSSPRPSPKPSPSPTVADPETPWYAQPTHQLLLAAVVVGSVTVAASSGMFDTDASRLTRAFEQSGITPGQYDRASTFLASRDTTFEGATKPEVQRLVAQLLAAGGVEAWLTGINDKSGVRTSHQLLIELPDDLAKRRSVFETYAKLARPGQQGAKDHGQRFLSLVF